jgi:hypothetical protein
VGTGEVRSKGGERKVGFIRGGSLFMGRRDLLRVHSLQLNPPLLPPLVISTEVRGTANGNFINVNL